MTESDDGNVSKRIDIINIIDKSGSLPIPPEYVPQYDEDDEPFAPRPNIGLAEGRRILAELHDLYPEHWPPPARPPLA